LALSVRRLILPGEPASPRVTRWQANAEVKRADFGLMWGPVIEASQAVGRVVSLQISVEAFRS
jgi:polyisoprenoid-binding protein YceI